MSTKRNTMSKIPVFVSCPTTLSKEQEKYNAKINKLLAQNGLERRALGRSDYPLENPLKEVYALARHCAGGLILGFEQLYLEQGVKKRGSADEAPIESLSLPTPWNNLEAGILYSLDLPLMIIKEKNIGGGIFDVGTSTYFVHSFESDVNLQQIFSKWVSKVYETYYGNK